MTPSGTSRAGASAPRAAAVEARSRRGRLTVYLGMCPGVGKTHAMLGAARHERARAVDVVIGSVATRGRRELEALLDGLPAIPARKAGEPDIEAILARRPDVVVMDELARCNHAGARHRNRYQDVLELLDAGIDVLTTLNVQEVESRADAVRQVTGRTVGETVPDSLLERADEVVLVDATPEMLRDRSGAGAAAHAGDDGAAGIGGFTVAHLTALREMTLRLVAERLERRLRESVAGAAPIVSRSGEKLLVGVGPSPFSTQLVRWTRRVAAAQGAAWLAVSVESSRALRPDSQRRLERNLALARELGAEVVVTHDDDVADALVRVAVQHNATQIVVGRSPTRPWRDLLSGGNLTSRLLRRCGPLDVCVVPAERLTDPSHVRVAWEPPERMPVREVVEVLGVLAAVSLASWLLVGYVGHLAVGLFYLLATIALSLRVGRWPVLVAGLASALGWNFLFIPPSFTFRIDRFEDGMMFVTYFAVALIAGQLTARIRAQERHERLREERATALFRLTQALGGARSLDDGVSAALRQADSIFNGQTALLLVAADGALRAHPASSLSLPEREREIATWAWQNRREAGRFTATHASAKAFHVPLARESSALGVLSIQVPADASLTLAQRELAGSFAAQLALLVESEHFRAAGEREKLLAESDRLHRALLAGVSHELKTPLAVLRTAAESLRDSTGATRVPLTAEILTATRRLHRVVNNLLDQTRLESGALAPRPDWCDANDLVNAARESVEDLLGEHPLEVAIPEDLPPFRADFGLMEQVMANLLLNAALHTPAGTPIFLRAGLETARQRIFFTVADRGPGLPPELREWLFRKFQRGAAAPVGGLGLGLSIVHGFVSAQGGEVVAGDNPGGGAVFTVYLPHVPHGNVPDE